MPGKRKRRNGSLELDSAIAALVYASESEDSEKGEWGEREWEVKKVTGEAIDMCGRREYRVEWVDWNRRKTGESFTWGNSEKHLENATDALEEWKAEAKAKRQEVRERHKREGVPISLFAHGNFARFNTTLLEIGMGTESDDEDYDAPSNLTSAIDLETRLDAIQMPSSRGKQRGIGVPPRRIDTFTPIPARERQSEGHNRRHESPIIPLGGDVEMASPIEASPPAQNIRNRLQALWDKATGHAQAAPVCIVNDVDDEAIPPSIDINKFQYCEMGYSGDIDSHYDILVGCDCIPVPCNPAVCECQQAADTAYTGPGNGVREFAYDKGLFTFKLEKPKQVVECNERCSCGHECLNRVAQKPRQVPMEVYKTESRGWAVRATKNIQKGQVIGIFTGELFEKDRAGNQYRRDGSLRDPGYIYDLDWFQPETWAIDSQFSGNWSRFLNHSCFPNLKVYPVTWDSVPDFNRGRLAFAAKERIPAGTQLTIDYWPHAEFRASCGCIYKNCNRR